MYDADVIIVGAGPVGMLSALLAKKAGLSSVILEKNRERVRNSRAIGITPPTLEILRNAGMDTKFIGKGVPVFRSEIRGKRFCLGRSDFSCLRSDFKFILAIPQNITESILEEEIEKNSGIGILRGYEVTGLTGNGTGIILKGVTSGRSFGPPFGPPSGEIFELSSKFAIACDGGKSIMRELIGVRFIGAPYKDTFIMGDFGDNSGWKDEARIFVTPRGSVESFPLPGEKRRYVLRTPYYIKENTSDYLEREIPERCGVEVGKARKYWESSFGVQHYIAERLYKNRVFLCGDAAHLMPPIGGQNMNVGFADSELAVWAAAKMISDERDIEKTALFYSSIRRKSAKSAASRAGILMKAGTSGGFVWSFIRSIIGFIIMHSIFKSFALSVAGMINLPYRNMASYR